MGPNETQRPSAARLAASRAVVSRAGAGAFVSRAFVSRAGARAVPWVLAAALAALAAALVLAVTGPADASSHCPSPDSGDPTRQPVAGFNASGFDLVLTGGGWGHGVGMSQYGALGAARLGCTYQKIIETYYPGAKVVERQDAKPSNVRVGLFNVGSQSPGTHATVRADGSAVVWRICNPGSDCVDLPTTQPKGATWRVRARSGSSNVLEVRNEANGAVIWTGGVIGSRLRAMHSGNAVTVRAGALTREFRWGYTEFEPHGSGDGRMYAVQVVTSGSGHTGMDRYLWGIAEVPSSWPNAALRAQVIAARSYAAIRVAASSESRHLQCRCHLYSTTVDQVYSGWTKEKQDAGITNSDGVTAPWKTAVNATAGRVAEYTGSGSFNGRIVDMFYSSSHGGIGEASIDVWGGDVPYLKAVNTSRWEDEVASANRYHRWTVGFTRQQIAQRADLHSFTSFELTSVAPGGRPTRNPPGVRITGKASNGTTVVRTYNGEALRSLLGSVGSGRDSSGASITGIRSARLVVNGEEPQPPPVDITAACPPGSYPRGIFNDVPSTSPHAAAIDCMAAWEVARGVADGKYAPSWQVTRGQMATFIARTLEAAGVALPTTWEPRFTDIDGHPHETAINQLAELGLVRGAEEGVYGPSLPVLRAQMATFIAGAYELAAGRSLAHETGWFDDVSSSSPHGPSINKLRTEELISGVTARRFDPRGEVTRAQMSSFLARGLNGLVEEGVTSPPW